MKKKITAAALALCLVLGLLPMSVLAARYTGTLNGQEITIDVDDTSGNVTLPEDLAAHYSVAPEKLTVDTTTGKFPKTQEFTLHYDGAPTNLKINGTLEEEPAAKTFTVTFAAGDHATGTKATETLTVPEGETTVEYTLPNETGFTPASGYVFSGWKVDTDTAVKAAGEKITVSADVTLTAQWTKDETVVTVTPQPGADGNATVAAKDVTVTDGTETVVLDLSTHESAAVTIQADLVASVKDKSVETVKIQTSSATADVPVDVLPASGDAKVEVKPVTNPAANLPADTADAVKTAVTGAAKAVSVAVTDKDGNNLLRKKDSYQAADPTVTITINGLVTGKTYVVLCLSVDGAAKSLTSFGKYASIAGTTLEVKSRHLSDFIAVEETTDNAAALAAVAEDPGKADAVTPPATTVKVESVKTDIAQFTKVQVSGLDKNKVYLIAVGKVGSTQSNSVISGVDTHEFYCNTQGGKQTISVYEFASKDALGAAKDITDNLKVRTEVAKVTE